MKITNISIVLKNKNISFIEDPTKFKEIGNTILQKVY